LKNTADHASKHICIDVHNIIISSKTNFSHNCLNNGVILELCENLLFLDFHCPKVQVNMPFMCNTLWGKPNQS